MKMFVPEPDPNALIPKIKDWYERHQYTIGDILGGLALLSFFILPIAAFIGLTFFMIFDKSTVAGILGVVVGMPAGGWVLSYISEADKRHKERVRQMREAAREERERREREENSDLF